MTVKAQIGLRFQKQLIVLRFMRIVAGRAGPGRGRTMNDFMVDLVGMTHETEVSDRLDKKFVLIRRVRIMAGSAHAVFYGRVDMRFLPKGRMAHETKGRHFLH